MTNYRLSPELRGGPRFTSETTLELGARLADRLRRRVGFPLRLQSDADVALAMISAARREKSSTSMGATPGNFAVERSLNDVSSWCRSSDCFFLNMTRTSRNLGCHKTASRWKDLARLALALCALPIALSFPATVRSKPATQVGNTGLLAALKSARPSLSGGF